MQVLIKHFLWSHRKKKERKIKRITLFISYCLSLISVAMIYLVVNEALLFNIFAQALYKIMQRDIFSFLIFINPTRVIQAAIPG